MDMFTMTDRLGREVPRLADLARLPMPLPVAAYSRRTFADTVRPYIASELLEELMRDLDRYFQPIDAASFDRKNPTTWAYNALLLKPAAPS
jgi:hypothetical protein